MKEDHAAVQLCENKFKDIDLKKLEKLSDVKKLDDFIRKGFNGKLDESNVGEVIAYLALFMKITNIAEDELSRKDKMLMSKYKHCVINAMNKIK